MDPIRLLIRQYINAAWRRRYKNNKVIKEK